MYNHPLIDQVIVVQNFSVDNTSKVVKAFIKRTKSKKVKLLEEYERRGKAYAMYRGVAAAKSQIVLFLDADLWNLNEKNVTDLVSPLIKGETDQTIGFRGDSLFLFKWVSVDPIGGERALEKNVFLQMPDCRGCGFGIESLINDFIIRSKKKTKVVPMPNVHHTLKYVKRGFFRGWYDDFGMIRQIFRAVPFWSFTKNMFYLSKHRRE